MDDLIKEFLIESHENLDRLERDLVELEKDPHDKETLSSIFRTIHTLKGSAGFLGYGQLEAVSHVGENLLSRILAFCRLLRPSHRPLATILAQLVSSRAEHLFLCCTRLSATTYQPRLFLRCRKNAALLFSSPFSCRKSGRK